MVRMASCVTHCLVASTDKWLGVSLATIVWISRQRFVLSGAPSKVYVTLKASGFCFLAFLASTELVGDDYRHPVGMGKVIAWGKDGCLLSTSGCSFVANRGGGPGYRRHNARFGLLRRGVQDLCAIVSCGAS